jgi:hypothetical protein
VVEADKAHQRALAVHGVALRELGQFRKQVERERGESFTEPEATATILRRR